MSPQNRAWATDTDTDTDTDWLLDSTFLCFCFLVIHYILGLLNLFHRQPYFFITITPTIIVIVVSTSST